MILVYMIMFSVGECVRAYKNYGGDFGDVSNVNYSKYYTKKIKGLKSVCENFFDSVLVWYYGPLKSFMSVRNYVKNVLSELKLDDIYVECIGNGTSLSDDFIEEGTRYVSCNVTLYKKHARDVLLALSDNNVLKKYNIVVRYTDVASDNLGCKNRQEMLDYLLSEGYITLNDVVDDINKVGKNCLSFKITINGIEIIVRAYNKFVELLESPGVRKTIGSSLSMLVYTGCERFRKSLKKCKKHGMMRVEVRVPGPKVYDMDTYDGLMNHIKDMFEDFKFYKTSFKNQYKALVDEVCDKDVVMLYFVKEKVFSYGHWCNGLTGKIQGHVKENVKEEYVETLKANYSFNGRITKFIRIDENGVTITYYKRVTKNITFTIGLRGSLYPCLNDLESYYKSFKKMGLTNYKGMKFGWIDYVDKRSKPLADLKLVKRDENLLRGIYKPNKKQYKAACKILQPSTTYKVVALCKDIYMSKCCIFIKAYKDGVEYLIRCGDILYELLKDFETYKYFYISTGKKLYRSRNVYDIECSLVL